VARETLKVLDASVILKWFLKEQDSSKAVNLKRKIINGELIAIAPDLILYELANALRYKKGYKPELVSEAINAIIDLDMEIIVPTESLIKESAVISFEKDISIYDAIYVALAKETGYNFITADKKLYQSIKELKFTELL
jgi:predicted nucleic acid-binding protein